MRRDALLIHFLPLFLFLLFFRENNDLMYQEYMV